MLACTLCFQLLYFFPHSKCYVVLCGEFLIQTGGSHLEDYRYLLPSATMYLVHFHITLMQYHL